MNELVHEDRYDSILISGMHAIQRDVQMGVEAHGELTLTQYRILLAIDAAERPPRLVEVASLLEAKTNSVGAAVESLCRKGFVERDVDTTDRRASLLSLTEAGRQSLARTNESVLSMLRVHWSKLTPEEIDVFGGSVDHFAERAPEFVRHVMSIREHSKDALSVQHITSTQYMILLRLAEQQQVLRIGELAKALGRKPTTLSMAVDVLARRGAVRRSKSPDDRRAVSIELTQEGAGLVSAVREGLEQALDDALADIPEETRSRYAEITDIVMGVVEREGSAAS